LGSYSGSANLIKIINLILSENQAISMFGLLSIKREKTYIHNLIYGRKYFNYKKFIHFF